MPNSVIGSNYFRELHREICGHKLCPHVQHVWESEWGASGDPYVFINQEQFITNMERVVNTKDLRKKIAQALPYFFQVICLTSSR